MKEIHKLLDASNLSKTPCRIEVLKTLLNSNAALSDSEIRQNLEDQYDRTTIYRTLKNFLNQDVIHSITLENGEVRYALTHQNQKKNTNHIHFYCNHCNSVYCISPRQFSFPELPQGFSPDSFDLLIHGQCNKCI